MKALAAFALTVACALATLATTTVAASQSATTSSAMTNADVIKLVKAGLSDALIQLRTPGVRDAVSSGMITPKPKTAPPTAATPATVQATAPTPANRAPVRVFKDGMLDDIKLYVDKPQIMRVVMRPFSATDADIVNGEKKDETKTMQADGPRLLAERFVAKLKEIGPFTEVSVLDSGSAPADTLVVEGKFIELDPGSRAKRYFAGFGAGKSAVAVNGSVLSADGVVLATFEHRRIGVMGAFGGDSLGKLASDTKSLGEDIAKFLSAWATGKKLK